jgi:hypothetical protein
MVVPGRGFDKTVKQIIRWINWTNNSKYDTLRNIVNTCNFYVKNDDDDDNDGGGDDDDGHVNIMWTREHVNISVWNMRNTNI